MPLPLLGLATGIGKKLLGGAKRTGTAVKSGAKKTVSSGKFLAKKSIDKGADLAQSGVEVAKKGTTNVIKGAKFFKKKVGSVGGSISKRLKENATSIKNLLNKGNKKQDKLRAKGTERKKKKESIEKKREKEKEVESKKSTSGPKRNILSSLAKSPLSILDKLFGFGGILLGGILVNAAKGLIDKGKKFMEDNKELFDTIGNFLTGVKDAVGGLLDSFTGPESEKGAFDDFAKFGDDGKLLEAPNGGALSEIVKTFTDLGPVVLKLNNLTKNPIVRALEKSGAIKERSITDRAKEFISGKGAGQLDSYEGSTPGAASSPTAQPAKAGTESTNQPSTGPIDPAHGAGTGSSLSKTKFVAGKGDTNKRIFLHWSAGSHTTPYDAYHSIALGDGSIVRHTPYGQDKGTHTGGANTGSVGLAIAAAAGAQERGKLGQYAPTKAQLDAMIYDAAKLAAEWGWSEGTIDSNVRTHGEWERYATRNGILSGSPQRWDLDRLRDSDPLIDASKVLSGGGNELRQRIKATFRLIKQQANISSSTTPTAANITPTENKTLTASAINQPMDDEGGETIFLQRVNNIQYVPFPVTA